MTMRIVEPSIRASTALKPRYERFKLRVFGDTVMVNLPSMSVVTPLFVALSIIATPVMGKPSSADTTTPVIVLSCAIATWLTNAAAPAISKNLFINT